MTDKALETVSLNDESCELEIIDQTRLPSEWVRLGLWRIEDISEAISSLRVRGAPAIGAAAAVGLYAASIRFEEGDYPSFARRFFACADTLAATRPTAVNLFWAIGRMKRVVERGANFGIEELKTALKREALAILDEDREVCRKIGENGLTLLKDGWGILTHCNAGRLATAGIGTALAPIYEGRRRGMNFSVYADETRPLLQGARLTCRELTDAGVDTTLICDNMAASVMKKGLIHAVLVGCDRVAANGDTANKIGTLMVAVLARHYSIPFYVCAPFSTVDMDCPDGEGIKIEERDPDEVRRLWYKSPMAPGGVNVFNPAFDVTDAGLITAIITERGIACPPFSKSLKGLSTSNGGDIK